ncbi:MAG: hypothetical protein ACLFR0_02360 [Alphaproteobacteria bacterium]
MRILAILCSVFVLFGATQANATPKPWYWSWWPSHWDDQDFMPHLRDPKLPHNTQWQSGLYNNEDWHPENWIRAKGSIRDVLDGFYKNDIIREQDVDGDIPVLVVGDGFMNLSGREKRRVATFIDYAFQVTTAAPAGMYSIYYYRTDTLFGRGNPIGAYTSAGLQLQ